jgi:hypothetical protein
MRAFIHGQTLELAQGDNALQQVDAIGRLSLNPPRGVAAHECENFLDVDVVEVSGDGVFQTRSRRRKLHALLQIVARQKSTDHPGRIGISAADAIDDEVDVVFTARVVGLPVVKHT